MQFDSDIQGEFSALFLEFRALFLSFDEMHEVKNAKQTSYKDRYGRAVCLMRTNDKYLRVIFAQGVNLEKLYPFLLGEGKIVRHLTFSSLSELKQYPLKEMIQESLILNMEAVELNKMKKMKQ
jgi:hypothetical protein